MLFYRSTLDLDGFYKGEKIETYPLNEQQREWIEAKEKIRIGVFRTIRRHFFCGMKRAYHKAS